MRFYIAEAHDHEILDCFTRFKDAKKAASRLNGRVISIDVPVTGESIRALLSTHGGYATSSDTVWESAP